MVQPLVRTAADTQAALSSANVYKPPLYLMPLTRFHLKPVVYDSLFTIIISIGCQLSPLNEILDCEMTLG